MKYHEVEPKDNMKVDPSENEVIDAVRPKVGKVVTGDITKPKRGLIRRLVDGVAGPDGVARIREYVVHDIVLPAIKNIIADSIKSSIDMALFGENRSTKSSADKTWTNNRYVAPKTNYGNSYDKAKPVANAPAVRAYHHVEDYIIEDRANAAEILNSMVEQADSYNNVSVADYYAMLGVESKFTDNNYGWTIDNIIKATIMPIRGGYIIKFPPIEVLD